MPTAIARPPLSILPRLGGQKLIPPFAQRLEDAAVQAAAQLQLATERTHELADTFKLDAFGPEVQKLGEARTSDLLALYGPLIRGLVRQLDELETSKSLDAPLSPNELAGANGDTFQATDTALQLSSLRTWLLGLDALALKLELEIAFGVRGDKADLWTAIAASTMPRPLRAQLEQRSGLDLRKLTRELRERRDPTTFAQLESLRAALARSRYDLLASFGELSKGLGVLLVGQRERIDEVANLSTGAP